MFPSGDPFPHGLQGSFSSYLDDTNRSFTFDIDVDFELARERTGFAYLKLFSHHDTLLWDGFYPYHFLPESPRFSGLGTLAHVMTLLCCANKYRLSPSTVVKHTVVPGLFSEKRAAHLAAMGIDPRRPTPFDEYLERSLTYARSRGFRFDV